MTMFRSAMLLTIVNLLLRFVGTSFQVFLSSRIGAAGIGLLQLTLSVGSMAMVAGMGGIRTAAMYLCAGELGRKQPQNVTQHPGAAEGADILLARHGCQSGPPGLAAVIKKWLRTFYWRFFSQQFKRNCMPDGVKVGSVGLGPRGDWAMPSDAVSRIWLDEVEAL